MNVFLFLGLEWFLHISDTPLISACDICSYRGCQNFSKLIGDIYPFSQAAIQEV
jgi:hypothetical protein